MDINKLMQQAQAMQKQLEDANRQMIEDLLMIAVNDAVDKVEEYKKERFGSMASALGIPRK